MSELFQKIDRWIDNLSAECVLAEAESDDGQLPIRDLFSTIQDNAAKDDTLSEVGKAAASGVELLDLILEDLRCFHAEDLQKLEDLVDELKNLRQDPDRKFEGVSSAPASTSRSESDHVIKELEQSITAEAQSADPPFVILELSSEIESELVREFLSEAYEHLDAIEHGALVLEEEPNKKETLDRLFRAFHSLKGNAGFLQLVPINKLAHELESLLECLRQDMLSATPEIIDVILRGGDILKEAVIEVDAQIEGRFPRRGIHVYSGKVIKAAKDLMEGKEVVLPEWERKAQPSSNSSECNDQGSRFEFDSLISQNSESNDELEEANAGLSSSKGTSQQSFVKVSTEKLDALVDLAGEMVIAQSLVAGDPKVRQIQSPVLARNMAHLSRITNELQRTSMAMRMLAIKPLFEKMRRLVRDTSTKLDKKVRLHFEGEDTELDKSIIEELNDPLVHMLRNALDHGLESPEERATTGKEETGEIWLRAYHQGGNIIIEVEDNGKGLDRERIFNKAVEKGIVHSSDHLSDSQVYELIFAPGFSTASEVSDLSGRGVGMDVVRQNIERLRGKVDVESTAGQGTRIIISLPLTLAIIDGLVVSVGDQRYIVPTLSVKESFRPSEEMLSLVHAKGEMMNVRGRLSPLLRLHQHFNVNSRFDRLEQAIVVVVSSGGEERCILVDELVGKQEVVIKSLDSAFKDNKALAGAAILGDGTVGLILDAASLVHLRV